MSIYSSDVVSKDVLKSFRNLLQGGYGTSTKKLDEDLDILWASKGGNVDLSKWSKDDFSTGLIPDYFDCKYFAGKPMATNNFGLCFTAKEKFYRHFLATTFFHLATEKKFRSPVGACRKKLISDPGFLWVDSSNLHHFHLVHFQELPKNSRDILIQLGTFLRGLIWPGINTSVNLFKKWLKTLLKIFGDPWCFIGCWSMGVSEGQGGGVQCTSKFNSNCHGKMINKFRMKHEKLMLPYSTCFAFTELNIDKAKGCFH